MAKIKFVGITIIIMIFICVPFNNVKALDNGCTPGYGYELKNEDGHPLTFKSGIEIFAGKTQTAPKNVVVIGQDPKGEGVSLQVTITSDSGQLVFDSLEPETYCDGPYKTNYPDKNKTICKEDSIYGPYYYLNTRHICVHHNSSQYPPKEPVYRLVRSVRIWLKPSDATRDWLGGVAITSDNRYGLHYIYPSQWMVGTFSGDGVSTQGTYTGMTGGYYQAWLSQMQGFNFLAGSGETYNSFLSNVITQVPDPLGGKGVLGLYGSFSQTGDTTINGPDINPINITCDLMSTRANAIYGNNNETIALKCPFTDVYQKDNNPPTETITLDNIPLDVPGLWYIGVEVQMYPAFFYYEDKADASDNISVTEHPSWISNGPENSFWFGPTLADTNYDILNNNNAFNSYIMLTSPCNYQEIKGCWDGSQ